MKDFIIEINKLTRHGVIISDKKYEFNFLGFVCDIPARVYLKLVKNALSKARHLKINLNVAKAMMRMMITNNRQKKLEKVKKGFFLKLTVNCELIRILSIELKQNIM